MPPPAPEGKLPLRSRRFCISTVTPGGDDEDAIRGDARLVAACTTGA